MSNGQSLDITGAAPKIVDARESLMVFSACACHDSHGVSWGEDGSVTETHKVTRCAEHHDRPSIYPNLTSVDY